jgi:hypothetical protein
MTAIFFKNPDLSAAIDKNPTAKDPMSTERIAAAPEQLGTPVAFS